LKTFFSGNCSHSAFLVNVFAVAGFLAQAGNGFLVFLASAVGITSELIAFIERPTFLEGASSKIILA